VAYLREFVELNKGIHDRESFDCGNNELNNFIKTQAAKHAKQSISKTYVLPSAKKLDNGMSSICAFYTLSPASLDRETLPSDTSKKLPHYPIPVILLGQLAVNNNFKGHGLGKITLIKALKFAQTISNDIGGYAVVVDCLDKSIEKFYCKYGFQEIERINGKMKMFLPMKTIKALP